MNRKTLQQLALTRVRDAEILLGAQQWSGAYYLAGYAVECGLKACIAKLTNQHDFPDKDRTLKSYTHRVEVLADTAGILDLLITALRANPAMSNNWITIKDWNEQARYEQWTEIEARELFEAVSHPKDVVLPWILGHW